MNGLEKILQELTFSPLLQPQLVFFVLPEVMLQSGWPSKRNYGIMKVNND